MGLQYITPIKMVSGGGSFTPLSLSPLLWIDFTNSSTVTLSGSNITAVSDLSGNGNNFTSVADPTYSNNVYNTLSAALFNAASNTGLISTIGPSINIINPITVWCVYRRSASATTDEVLLTIPFTSGTPSGSTLTNNALGTGDGLFGWGNSTAVSYPYVYTNSFGSALNTNFAGIVTSGANNTSVTLANGTSSGTPVTTDNYGVATFNPVIGGRYAGGVVSFGTNAYIFELGIVTRIINGTEMGKLTTYFTTKYGTP